MQNQSKSTAVTLEEVALRAEQFYKLDLLTDQEVNEIRSLHSLRAGLNSELSKRSKALKLVRGLMAS